jgi:hypothetical protein
MYILSNQIRIVYTETVPQGREDLGAPSLPRLKLNLAVVLLGLAQELLQRPRAHVLRDKDQPGELDRTLFVLRGLASLGASRAGCCLLLTSWVDPVAMELHEKS